MFLSIKKGVWYGAKGILTLGAGIITGIATLSWLHGYKKSREKQKRQELLLYGLHERNLFHWLGDVWNSFRKKR